MTAATSHGYPDAVDIDDVVSATEAAAIGGVKLDTFTAYVNRGQAPAALERRIAGRRVWSRKQIEAWAKNRPGRGRRMDLDHVRAEVEKKTTPKKPRTRRKS